MKRLRTFVSLPAVDQRALAGAALRLLVARGALAVLPYRMVQRHYGRPQRELPPNTDVAAYRGRAVWAVRAAGRRMLGDRPCLAQALVVERLLRRSGAVADLRLGVVKAPDGELRAHAWVECDGEVVIGHRASREAYVPFRTLERARDSALAPAEGRT
jgi:hypothetical protein